jgi:alpha-L-rhamnosidase
MMGTIIGIRPGSPGWREFTLAPEPGADLTFAKGHYDSPQGRISVDWKVEGDTLSLECVVPANTRATLQVPHGWKGNWPTELGSGSHSLKAARG